MQDPAEIFDIVNEHDRVTGQATRAEVHRLKLRHRAVHILLFNSRGELLIQKRSAAKDSFPGCYDSSASGHLDSGEDYDACAYRELREELGLNLPAGALTRQFKLPASPETGWEFVWIYTTHGDYRVTPNPAELESIIYCDRGAALALPAESCARSFRCILAEVDARGLFPYTTPHANR